MTSFDDRAFSGCTALAEITVPDSVTRLGDDVFYNTPWLEAMRDENPFVVVNGILIDGTHCEGKITIPANVTSISCAAFSGCSSITEVTIPEGVTSIGASAFFKCRNLNEIVIPESVTFIGSNAFYDTPWFSLKQKEDPFTIINGILIDGKSLDFSITIPDGVTAIADGAFNGSQGITEVTVPEQVRSIGAEAFANCLSLTDITILNPACEISDAASTIYEFAAVHGYAESTAAAYADAYNRQFVPLENTSEVLKGDINDDGKVGADDAQITLQAYVNALAGKGENLTDKQKKAADIDSDGKISATDAQIILQYYVARLAGKNTTWEDLLPDQ